MGPKQEINYAQTKAVIPMVNQVCKVVLVLEASAKIPAPVWNTRRAKTLGEEEEGNKKIPFH